MYTEKRYPRKITPNQLDQYLSKGWYRMNQMIFTVHFLYTQSGLFGPVWLRYNIEDWTSRKSISKLKRKNDALYTTIVREASFSEVHEELYQKYKANFDGQLAPTLRENILGPELQDSIYHSFLVEVYDGTKMLAFSIFDKGHESIASILGVYDPDYSAHSLGIYTMIKEIEWARLQKLKYYYPGYFVPNWSRFDYKLRFGEGEFFDPFSERWIDMRQFDETATVLSQLKCKLYDAQEHLLELGLPSKTVFNPFFEQEWWDETKSTSLLLRSPLLVILEKDLQKNRHVVVLLYDMIKFEYHVISYALHPLFEFIYTTQDAQNFESDLIALTYFTNPQTILRTGDIAEIEAHHFQ